jgi:hypothetical protein
MRYRQFQDYIAARNVISEWLDGLPVATRIEFQLILMTLEQQLKPPSRFLAPVKGNKDGLWEVRLKCLIEKIQWRPIAYYGPHPRQMTLLAVARMDNNEYNPRNICKVAKERKRLVEADPSGRKCEHGFD